MNTLNNRGFTRRHDQWKFIWNNTKYSTKKTYIELMGKPPHASAPFTWIWKSACLSKQKFFFWLLIQDRLNTRELLIRKNFYGEDETCVPCSENDTKDIMHLFFSCDFSQSF